MKRSLILAVVLAGACSHPPREVPAPGDLAWVAHEYEGGVQCQKDYGGYRPPQTRAVLRRVRVTVHFTVEQPLIVCEACSCSGYAMMHYALIAATDTGRAARAGYVPRTPPTYLVPDSLRSPARQ